MAWEGLNGICYGDDGATFLPVCEKCGRFVKADAEITFDGEGQPKGTNATCSKCGRIEMIWEGYI